MNALARLSRWAELRLLGSERCEANEAATKELAEVHQKMARALKLPMSPLRMLDDDFKANVKELRVQTRELASLFPPENDDGDEKKQP